MRAQNCLVEAAARLPFVILSLQGFQSRDRDPAGGSFVDPNDPGVNILIPIPGLKYLRDLGNPT